jgi:hypothetical protein
MRKIFYVMGCLLVVAAASWVWKSQAEAPQTSDQTAMSKEELRLKEMALQSDMIVTGQSVNTESRWIEGGRVLVTLATISVGEVVKGEPASSVTVVLPGGTDANRRFPVQMTYPGAPTISPQEEVFLFLTETDSVPGGYAVAGFNEGKFSIVKDEAGNKLVSHDYIRGEVSNGPGFVRGNRQFIPISAFKNQIKGLLGQ